MKLLGSIIAREDLSAADRDAMFALMDRMYANMRREAFEADLRRKRWVIRLAEPGTNRWVGFSTQTLLEETVGDTEIAALFSGDTVVEREHWGDTALASCWGKFALQLIEENQHRPFYWFLISKGFRTYRYLPLFFREYFPRRDRQTPASMLHLLNALGRRLAPAHYDARTQIIRAGRHKEYVRAEYSNGAPRTKTDRHVEFFCERNPHHERGDELCCLAPLTRENFTPLAWRMIHAQSPRSSLAQVSS